MSITPTGTAADRRVPATLRSSGRFRRAVTAAASVAVLGATLVAATAPPAAATTAAGSATPAGGHVAAGRRGAVAAGRTGIAAAAPGLCQDSWKQAGGGKWSNGKDWSRGAPPGASQRACITIGLSAPVVLTGDATAASLTIGGNGASAELELEGGSLTLSSASTIEPSGELATSGVTATLRLAPPARMTNRGTVRIAYDGLELGGHFVNAAGASVDVVDTSGWTGSSGGTLWLLAASTFTNDGTVTVQPYATIEAPYDGGSGTVIDNAAGTIENAGSVDVGAGASFVQGAGKIVGSVAGNDAVSVDGGSLELAGQGVATFELRGAPRISGTVAPDQTLLTESAPGLTTSGSFVNDGLIATEQGSSTITIPAGAVLDNAGTILAVHGDTLDLAGAFDNEASGTIEAAGSAASSTIALDSGSTLTNRGAISITAFGSLDVPAVGSSTSVLDNAAGGIVNDGALQVGRGGTFIEGAGTETGAPVLVGYDALLDLRGSGASSFELVGVNTFEGDIAKDQSVELTGTVKVPASFTNFGTLTARSTNIVLPIGGALTNDGIFDSPPSTQELVLDGNLVNTPAGVVDMNGNAGYGANLYLGRPGTAFDNEGALEMGHAFLGLLLSNQTFESSGTIEFGVAGGAWGSFGLHSTIQATGKRDKLVLDGVINPVLTAETELPLPWPRTSTSIVYGAVIAALATPSDPEGAHISCAASVGGGWRLACAAPQGAAVLSLPSRSTLDPTVTTVTSSSPQASYGEITSDYGTSITLTATVRSQIGPAPTGPVTFYDVVGASNAIDVLGTSQLHPVGRAPSGSGASSGALARARLTISSFAVGIHDITARYGGDAHSLASSSDSITQEVAEDKATATIAPGPPSRFGQPATLIATVTPSGNGPAPSGEVVFLAQEQSLFLGAAPVSTIGGVTKASITTTGLAPGTDNVVAIYSGDLGYGYYISPSVERSVEAPGGSG